MIIANASYGLSEIHHIGLFAREAIQQGAVIWQFQQGFDLRLSDAGIEALAPAVREQVRSYSFFVDDHYLLSSDDARFINHADTPNMRFVEQPPSFLTTRGITEGEELTADYATFDNRYKNKERG